MFVKVGSTFPHEGAKYKCVDASELKRSDACNRCALRFMCENEESFDLDCTKFEREDKKEVYFEELPTPEVKDLTMKKGPREMFRRISNYIGKGRYIEYREDENGRYGEYKLLLRDESLIYIQMHFTKGEMDWFKTYPSEVKYFTDKYYLKKLYVYSKSGKVDKVEFE